jgi:hypothetical protein
MYHFFEIVTIISRFGTSCFASKFQSQYGIISVLLGFANFSLISSVSSIIISLILAGVDKICCKSVMISIFNFNSSSIFCLSNQAKVCNLIAKIASV